jgi:predicted dehydrogenase
VKEKLQLIQCGVSGFGGGWLQHHTTQSPDFELAAIVDINADALRQGGEQAGLPENRRFTSLEAALAADFHSDAVLTVTPPAVHVQHARLAFEAGKHVLTEKPIAATLEEAAEMVALAKAHRRQLAVSQNYRFRPPIQTMRRLLAEEVVGVLGHGHLDFYIAADFAGSFRETMEYPLLVDMAIHHFDLIRCLTGRDIVKITAHSFRPEWSWYRHEPGLKALLELEGGLPFSYSGDWSARGRSTSWSGNWRLQCAAGSLHLENDRVLVARGEKWMKDESVEEIEPAPLEYAEQAATLHLFAQAIRSGEAVEISGERNIASFAAVIAGVQSAQSGQTADVRALLKAAIRA